MSSVKKMKAEQDLPRTGRRQIIGIVLIGLTIMLLFSLFSYNPWDISVLQNPPGEPVTNIIGLVGAWTSYLAFLTLGLAAYVLPVLTGTQGLLCMYGEELRPGMKVSHKLGWMALLVLCVACGMELMQMPMNAVAAKLNIPFAGGALGHLLGAMVLMKLLGDIGTTIVLGVVVLISAICLFDFQVTALFKDPRGTLGGFFQKMHHWMVPPDTDSDEDGEIQETLPVKTKRKKKEKVPTPEPEPDIFVPASRVDDERSPMDDGLPFLPEPDLEDEPEAVIPIPIPVPEPEIVKLKTPAPGEPSVFKTSTEKPASKSADTDDDDLNLPGHAERGPVKAWTLPSISLLQEVAAKVESDGSREEYLRKHLENTLREFGVEARITEVQRGPVVTSFEVLPAAGVRVEKIASLSNNLALALKAESIRVQAPIPGKGVVGIEVPNNKSTVVLAR